MTVLMFDKGALMNAGFSRKRKYLYLAKQDKRFKLYYKGYLESYVIAAKRKRQSLQPTIVFSIVDCILSLSAGLYRLLQDLYRLGCG